MRLSKSSFSFGDLAIKSTEVQMKRPCCSLYFTEYGVSCVAVVTLSIAIVSCLQFFHTSTKVCGHYSNLGACSFAQVSVGFRFALSYFSASSQLSCLILLAYGCEQHLLYFLSRQYYYGFGAV